MRLFIITILTFGLFASANSQSIVDSTKTWNVIECMNFGLCKTFSYKFDGDTTIENQDYKKLYHKIIGLGNFEWEYNSALREDSGKVYRYGGSVHPPVQDEEYLVYNFNIAEGDTFYISDLYEYNELIVQEIDTVSLLNGEERLLYRFENSGDEWIEGIGSIHGPTWVKSDEHIVDLYYDLNCYYEDGLLLLNMPYDNSTDLYEDCLYNSLGFEENPQFEVSVSPNPANKYISISFENEIPKNAEIRIFDVQGRHLLTRRIGSMTTTIETLNFKSGTYILAIFNEGELLSRDLVVRR